MSGAGGAGARDTAGQDAGPLQEVTVTGGLGRLGLVVDGEKVATVQRGRSSAGEHVLWHLCSQRLSRGTWERQGPCSPLGHRPPRFCPNVQPRPAALMQVLRE